MDVEKTYTTARRVVEKSGKYGKCSPWGDKPGKIIDFFVSIIRHRDCPKAWSVVEKILNTISNNRRLLSGAS
jgi:hypothetical protein